MLDQPDQPDQSDQPSMQSGIQPGIPGKPSTDGLEAKWSQRWEDEGIYRFDRSADRERVFSIDTPPPTVSGSLHMGHIFSYTHTDTVARYRRMRGDAVFYPMGWDDNGLPTERRVQNYYGVRCDPSMQYDPSFEPPADAGDPKAVGARPVVSVSRRNFIELCHVLTASDEQAFEELWRRLGLSVDWSMTYATVDERCQRVAQRAFLANLRRGEAYQIEAPSLWDVTFGTAVAQAELEDRERPGAYHKIAFALADNARSDGGTHDASGHGAPGHEDREHREDSGHGTPARGGTGWDGATVRIDTTRPELLAACVALVAHPDDERYQGLFGAEAVTPVFGASVPILAHRLADPDKGTGIAMICTFGDTADVTWWRELNLPVRAIVDRRGRIDPAAPAGLSAAGREAYRRLAGKTMAGAKSATVEMLRSAGALVGEPRPIVHAVKFFEKGDRPLEIVTSRQWYIRNGGRDASLAAQLIARGDEMTWHPAHMQARYTNWIEGLTGDWLISRQRYFGVSIPLWYRLDDTGQPIWDPPLTPTDDMLPVDPSVDAPPGYAPSQRGQPGGFVGDLDVMDTWATSSLTPQIACGWGHDPDLWQRTFPMDMRPQGHDIIRTWLFSTAVRAHLEHGTAPWRHCSLSGWILDPDRKKMSKSRGNVVTPTGLLDTYGADAVRYWAASGRPGTDTAFDEGQMRIGRRLAVKLLNASKFVLSRTDGAAPTPPQAPHSHLLDAAFAAQLASLARATQEALDGFDYARSLELTEALFWRFTDDYIELVKGRAHGTQGEPARRQAAQALTHVLDTLLRLFAPFLPFVTEEVWSWWRSGSVHRTCWPDPAALDVLADGADGSADGAFGLAATVLSEVRRAKTEAKVSLKTVAQSVTVQASPAHAAMLEAVRADLSDAGTITRLHIRAEPAAHAESPQVDVTLA